MGTGMGFKFDHSRPYQVACLSPKQGPTPGLQGSTEGSKLGNGADEDRPHWTQRIPSQDRDPRKCQMWL